MQYPVKILQFGEGNFLRAFVEYMVDELNMHTDFNGSVAIVKAVPFGSLEALRNQNYHYTLLVRGLLDGREFADLHMVRCVADVVGAYEEYDRYMAYAACETLRFIVSNTTEAGIAFGPGDKLEDRPPKAFPSKLTQFLYARWLHFKGDPERGVYLLPCELIADNAAQLKKCVMDTVQLWELPPAFARWLQTACYFCDTLVDRIVSGYPGQEETVSLEAKLGCRDALLDLAEPFMLWVLENQGKLEKEFPLREAELPVVFTDNVAPYRERKVRILNGAHTAMAPAAFLSGFTFVNQCVADDTIGGFLTSCLYDEIIPTLTLEREDCEQFARQVLERFKNPFMQHRLSSILLNSLSKWRTRVLPSLRIYVSQKGRAPLGLTFSFAALLAYYMGHSCNGCEPYAVQDSEPTLDVLQGLTQQYMFGELDVEGYVRAAAGNTSLWGESLVGYEDFCELAADSLQHILRDGAAAAMRRIYEKQRGIV